MPPKNREEVECAFSPLLDYTVPVGSKVRVTLRPGLRVAYVHRNPHGHLVNEILVDGSTEDKIVRRKPYAMEGVYLESYLTHGLNELSDDPVFCFRKTKGHKKGYSLLVVCSDIADFKTL